MVEDLGRDFETQAAEASGYSILLTDQISISK